MLWYRAGHLKNRQWPPLVLREPGIFGASLRKWDGDTASPSSCRSSAIVISLLIAALGFVSNIAYCPHIVERKTLI